MQPDKAPTVICITFPRSGHHYLVQLLHAALGTKLIYCERYSGMIEGANLIKEHDFGLERVPSQSEPYLIQIRHPLNAIISRFEQNLRTKTLNDTRTDWERHARSEAVYWYNFFLKWILGVTASNRFQTLLIRYEDLIINPELHITAAIRLLGFTPRDNLDPRIIQEASKEPKSAGHPMDGYFIRERKPRSATSFRYYDRGFYQELLAPIARLNQVREWQYDRIPDE